MNMGASMGKAIGAQVTKRMGPVVTGQFVPVALGWAIHGTDKITGAAKLADKRLRSHGSIEDAAEALIREHLALAAGQGFITNLGGVMTAVVAVPTNIVAVAVLQSRLVAAIFHLKGYDLRDPAVQDAIMVSLLDRKVRRALGKDLHRTLDPEIVANAPHSETDSAAIAKAVAGELFGAAGAKRIAGFTARKVPVLGGVIGGTGDAWSTRRIGREAAAIPARPRYGAS